MNIPRELKEIQHEDDCTHTYLEARIDGKWKVIDATWDIGLKGLFSINQWGDKQKIAVKPIKIFSPKKSLEMVKEWKKKEFLIKDLKTNGKFYKAFNEWLEKNRK
ncbi:MAG: hypothetical protein HY517_03530 [Candidatus Aenigmarchaeota archaeon]|nr:hypothetical protein [Candidatus Aenigmarchaeota archaeon]